MFAIYLISLFIIKMKNLLYNEPEFPLFTNNRELYVKFDREINVYNAELFERLGAVFRLNISLI